MKLCICLQAHSSALILPQCQQKLYPECQPHSYFLWSEASQWQRCAHEIEIGIFLSFPSYMNLVFEYSFSYGNLVVAAGAFCEPGTKSLASVVIEL